MCCKLRNKQYKVLKEWLDCGIDACGRLFKVAMKTLGPLMFTAANLLAGSVIYILLFILTPPLYSRNKLLYGVQLVFIVWGSVNIYFNYWACMLTQPGSPELLIADPSTVLGTKVYTHNGDRVSKSVTVVEIEPDVSYSVSGRCVLNMDHFCPWMCNCVGYRNYRYFVLFLVYMCIGSFYVVCFTFTEMIKMSPRERSHFSFRAMLNANPLDNFRAAFTSFTTFAFCMAISAFISTFSLLMWHSYLIFTNQTTIEFYINMANRYDHLRRGLFKNPFDEGWRKNLRRVTGDVPWYTHLWPNFAPPPEPRYSFTYDDSIQSYSSCSGVNIV